MTAGVKNAIRLLLINVSVTLLLCTAALGAVELYLRITIPSSSGGSLFESTLSTKRFKVMKRDYRIIAFGKEFRTNELGFRDNKDEVEPKHQGRFRVLVVGDSFTASAGVDFDKIYTSLLQSQLRRTLGDVDVVNIAVGGYNLVQEELLLDEVGWSFQPDLVVLAAFPFNDLSNDTYRANYDEAMGRVTTTRRYWYEDLYVYRAFLVRVESRLKGLLARWLPAEAKPASPSPASNDAEENLAALDRTVNSARAHSVPLAIVLLPNTDNFTAQRGDFAPFQQACAAHMWDCLDLLPSFATSGENPDHLRLNRLDPHPNDEYNSMVASFLSRPLIQRIEATRSAATAGCGPEAGTIGCSGKETSPAARQ